MAISAVQEIAEIYKRSSTQPWESNFGSVRVAPHCWYIGDSWVGVTMIATKAGLALIDAGLRGQTFLLFEEIRHLGYDPQHDIKLCMLTHAHLDHCSGLANLQNYSHPVTYMSPYEKHWIEHPELYYNDFSASVDQLVPYQVDRLYDYKTPIVLGEFSFTILHTPGHTPGCSSMFFTDYDETTGQTYRVALHGGLGLATIADCCYTDAGTARRERAEFRRRMEELRELPVDICIANHPEYIDMEKRICHNREEYRLFVDNTIWRWQLDRKLSELTELEQGSIFR